MSRVWTIAKREYSTYFKSAIGWVVFAIYTVIASFYYSVMLRYNYVDTSAVLQFMRGLFFVLIPIITMKTFAAENKSGTSVIYYSSSMPTSQVVLGKYLAVILVFLTISSVNLIYVCVTLAFNGTIDSRYWGTLIAYLLTGFAYIAIGIFTSSFTKSQITSAMVSVVIFAAFEISDSLSKMIGSGITSLVNKLDVNDTIAASTEASIGQSVTDGLNWINPANKLTGFYEGKFSLLAVFYFIGVIIVFLYITTQIVESARWRK